MKKLRGFIAILLAGAGAGAGAGVVTNVWSQDGCAYSAAFQQVRSTLGGLSTIDATRALQAFAVKPQSPDLCEAAALDDALGEREKLLVTLIDKSGGENHAHGVSRCNLFNARTALCQSPNEDGTAHPNLTGTLTPLKIASIGSFDVKSQLPDAKLYALYITTLSNALDGKPTKRLTTSGRIKASALGPATVLIAIYKTQGTKNHAWAYRKAVSYFYALPSGSCR